MRLFSLIRSLRLSVQVSRSPFPSVLASVAVLPYSVAKLMKGFVLETKLCSLKKSQRMFLTNRRGVGLRFLMLYLPVMVPIF